MRFPATGAMSIEHVCDDADVPLRGREQRRLVAALLSRRHLILSGPADVGKCRLATALALAVAAGCRDQVRTLQGHPWWAARTGDVARYVMVQTEYNLWRLGEFLTNIVSDGNPQLPVEQSTSEYVVCIKRMSPAELEFYFGELALWLYRSTQDSAGGVPLRLIGTMDTETPPCLPDRTLQYTALVHLDRPAHQESDVNVSEPTSI